MYIDVYIILVAGSLLWSEVLVLELEHPPFAEVLQS